MLIKSALASDYSGVRTVPSSQQPASAVEFIQKITLLDYSAGTYIVSPTSAGPTSIVVDAPIWANFTRYKKIQFSFGPFTASTTDQPYMNVRKNLTTINTTQKYFQYEAISGTASSSYGVSTGSGTTSIPYYGLNLGVASSSPFIRSLDIFLTQLGGYADVIVGNMGTNLASSIGKFNFTGVNTSGSSYNIPLFLEGDSPGVVLNFSSLTTRFAPPHSGAGNILQNYKFDCSIYGWLK